MRKMLCTLLCLLLLALGGTALAEEMPQGLWMIPDYSGTGSPFNYVSIEVKENSDLQLWDKHWDVEDAPEARLPREGEMARRWYGGAIVREPQSGPKLTDFYIRDHGAGLPGGDVGARGPSGGHAGTPAAADGHAGRHLA